VSRTQGYAALEDAALCVLAGEGDGSALEELYARYGRVSYALARQVLGDDSMAADVVRDAFLTFWRDSARGGAVRLLTLTHREAVEAVRREEGLRRRRVVPAATPDLALPETQRQVLSLAYFGGFTQREVAAIAGLPLDAVKSEMLAALRRLGEDVQ
jgi:RNA polymerase sigma-70 factor (ECF subfamily)